MSCTYQMYQSNWLLYVIIPALYSVTITTSCIITLNISYLFLKMVVHSSLHLRDQHGLILTILQHIMVCIVTNWEDMGRHFWAAFSSVCKHNLLCVNGKSAIRIDGHTEQTRVCLQKGTIINREFNGFERENTYQKITNVGNKCNEVNCFLGVWT